MKRQILKVVALARRSTEVNELDVDEGEKEEEDHETVAQHLLL
jgi:hypothetical protein